VSAEEVEAVRKALANLRCACCNERMQLRKADEWGFRLDAYCTDCATTRCDAYPGACGKDRVR
jgi:hypothetical protein